MSKVKDIMKELGMLNLFTDGGNPLKTSKTTLIIDQLINSAIVGGIVFFLDWASDGYDPSTFWKSLGGFGLAFLVQLKKYRNI